MIVDAITKKIPSWTVSNPKLLKSIKWMGQHISSPENRLILGVTALMSQPFIDLYNKNVDEETRKVSAARTVAKIIAGTSTGVFIRWACIKAIDAFTKPMAKGVARTWKNLLLPTKSLETLSHYKNAMGTIISLAVMVCTNFLIDAPLTKYLTNKFVDKIHKKDASKMKEVSDE